MNRKLWNFFKLFFKFQNLICFDVKQSKVLPVNQRFLIFNSILPNIALVIFVITFKTGLFSQLIETESLSLRNASVLMIRLYLCFPILISFSGMIVNFFTINHAKLHESAKILMKITNLGNINYCFPSFKTFEMTSLLVFIFYYVFAVTGLSVNMVTMVKPNVVSFLFVILLNWNMYVATHVIFLYYLYIGFVLAVMIDIENEILLGKISVEEGAYKIYLIGKFADEIRSRLRFILSFANAKFVMEILLRVSWFSQCYLRIL